MEAWTPPPHVRVISCVWTLEELEAFNVRCVELLPAGQAPEGTVISAGEHLTSRRREGSRRPDRRLGTDR